ncbi:MAG: S28 family serine protease [Ferruginibacter sp.]
MKRILFPTAILFLSISLWAQTAEEKKLERALYDLPDIAFKKLSEPGDPKLRYMLRVKQQLDHNDISKGFFYQRVEFIHIGFDRPVVMNTQGYALNFGKDEIQLSLNANYLNVEHRFFAESVPDTMQWKYLTLEQVTADLHHINQLFKKLYKNKWVSTGISKGGQTTIFYKYFYPDDVDVAVPYVAPFNFSLEDRRIYRFLDSIGTPECRKKIFNLQEYLLQQEDKALEKLRWYAKGANLTFNYLDNSLGKAYELAVLELSFSFWQWGSSCDQIPVKQSLDSSLSYLLNVSGLDFFADAGMKTYASHYYQAGTQMGYYGYNIEPFKKYIKYFTSNPSAVFMPKDAGNIVYDNSLNEKADKWLREKGNNIIYIYGGYDTWSAERVVPSANVNSKSFILPGKDHGKARIKYMDAEMKAEVKKLLEQWTGLPVDLSLIK